MFSIQYLRHNESDYCHNEFQHSSIKNGICRKQWVQLQCVVGTIVHFGLGSSSEWPNDNIRKLKINCLRLILDVGILYIIDNPYVLLIHMSQLWPHLFFMGTSLAYYYV